jgi:hypothetical protein
MRMLMQIAIPVAAGNKAAQTGGIRRTVSEDPR